MFFPKTKLFSWIKSHWALLLIAATVLTTAIGGIQSCRANRWEAEAHRLDGKLAEQQADQDKLYGEAAKERAERNLERTAEKEKREELEAEIKRSNAEGEKAKRALVAEKAKTTLLPPTELVEEITERIGDEVTLTGDRLYLFTRTGTERTLNRFQDGEFYLSEYNRQLGVIKKHVAKEASFDTDLAGYKTEVATNLTGWDDCRETLSTAQKDIKALKKVGKASVWKGRKQGAGVVIIIGGVLKLFGVW